MCIYRFNEGRTRIEIVVKGHQATDDSGAVSGAFKLPFLWGLSLEFSEFKIVEIREVCLFKSYSILLGRFAVPIIFQNCNLQV